MLNLEEKLKAVRPADPKTGRLNFEAAHDIRQLLEIKRGGVVFLRVHALGTLAPMRDIRAVGISSNKQRIVIDLQGTSIYSHEFNTPLGRALAYYFGFIEGWSLEGFE